jgi:pimeloyl-ACP methyl ester carboxylesterase
VTRAGQGPVWSAETGAAESEVVVLVHGSMDRSAGMLRLSRQLDHRFRVLRYDRRGYGRSTPHPGPFGVDHQVADLVGLLDGRRAHVFGHSYGGNVALAVAERHPELVESVVVYETPLSWFDWWPGTTAGGTAIATKGEPAEAAERFMRRLIGDERWERLPPSTRAARRAEGAAMVGELTDLRERAPWSGTAVRAPVVALFGEHGAAHHRAAMEHLPAILPGCAVREIAGARHFGPNTHPGDVAAVIAELAGYGEEVLNRTRSAATVPVAADSASDPPMPSDS